MNDDEQLAEKYLNSLGRGAVVFEPDGNIPPDFTLGSSTAIEVRRLNQNFTDSTGKPEGLEKIAIPLWQKMKANLRAIAPSNNGECWYVGIDYRRPLERWRTLWPKAERVLQEFMTRPVRTNTTLLVTPALKLDIFRAGKDHGSFFVLGAGSDHDSGGGVLSELQSNLQLCVQDKERKISAHRHLYPEWWLVLPDYIAHAVPEDDREYFRLALLPQIQSTFDKIVLLDPRGLRHAFEA